MYFGLHIPHTCIKKNRKTEINMHYYLSMFVIENKNSNSIALIPLTLLIKFVGANFFRKNQDLVLHR